ncbi:MAG: hypothetical protein U5K30_07950 [Acidimicrobiales bacterium]|nr:hypothetical protein [Acidimicrobiales bacterium]
MQLVSGSFTRYRVHEPLGLGPDGPVHRARAERLGARPVALRRLTVPAGTARARLRRDAETIAALGHPTLAVVHDIVEIDDEDVLVAATLGDRGSLADGRTLGPLAVDEAAPLVRSVADALASAHRLGLAHGRVRATNVVFTDDGPVLCDLAQSAALGREASIAGDVADLVHLAASLVADADRSPRAVAYRAICRWSAESATDVAGLVAALDRLDQVRPAPPRPPPAPAPAEPRGMPVDATVGSAAAGLVVGGSLVVGTTVGALATLLAVL